MVTSIFAVLVFILCSPNKAVQPDALVGNYYVAAYSKSDFENAIALKKHFPIQSDSIYERENDVDKIVAFYADGNLTFCELPGSYFCGDLLRVQGGQGIWKRLNKKEVEIRWRGETAIEKFEMHLKYRIDSRANGDKILTPII